MTIKEQIRYILESRRGEYVSGEELAKSLYCTRSAVWKAITALRNEGCVITAATNRGYRLESESDTLSEAGIRRMLGEYDCDVIVKRSVGSTNALMRELAQQGAREGTLVAASHQTCGSGRRGRRFFSPPDTGLYMSILLRPSFSVGESVRITSAAAAAVCMALEEVCGAEARIKWVNDVYIGGKKAAGILTEASFGLENGALEYAVVGIGVNVYEPEGGFPEELRDIAGAVLEKPQPDMRNRLCAAITRKFTEIYRQLPDSGYMSEYRKRLMWRGEEILIMSGADGAVTKPAVMLGTDDMCGLLVRYEDGSEGVVSSGEISIRK